MLGLTDTVRLLQYAYIVKQDDNTVGKTWTIWNFPMLDMLVQFKGWHDDNYGTTFEEAYEVKPVVVTMVNYEKVV